MDEEQIGIRGVASLGVGDIEPAPAVGVLSSRKRRPEFSCPGGENAVRRGGKPGAAEEQTGGSSTHTRR